MLKSNGFRKGFWYPQHKVNIISKTEFGRAAVKMWMKSIYFLQILGRKKLVYAFGGALKIPLLFMC